MASFQNRDRFTLQIVKFFKHVQSRNFKLHKLTKYVETELNTEGR